MAKNKEKNFISAVVYVRNKEKEISNFLSHLVQLLQTHFENFEIICVNDASTDNSKAIIYEFSKTISGGVISILNMSFYQGTELSMNAGVDLAIGDFVYEFDMVYIDYPIELIYELYLFLLKGYDIAAAIPAHRSKIISNIFYRIYNAISNTQFRLKTETFRILSRRAINRIHAMSITIPYRKALYANCGLNIGDLSYENTISYSYDNGILKQKVNIAIDILILYSNAAYRCSIAFTCLLMLLTLSIGIYAVSIYLTGKPVAGWTTTILFLSIAFSGIFAVLTIIIKYLSIILNLIFVRQKYIIESIEKLTN